MSSSDSISSRSSFESDAATTSGRTSTQRPLPPPPPRRAGSSHSGQMLAAILRDRPLPLPTADQTTEERRQSILALDRKRRLTNPTTYDEARRRTINDGFQERRYTHDAYRRDGPSSPPARGHASSDPNRPLPEIVDLTDSSPPLPQTPRDNRLSRTSSNGSRRYVVPRWQPDSEVSECPICKRPFTWMFRRHHCRKCGRVVCNDCSPHRITIPRPFIVRPPGLDITASPSDTTARCYDAADLTEDDDENNPFQDPSTSYPYIADSHLEGGEKVRLCNPCVPDPQPDPLPNYPPPNDDFPTHEGPWSTATAQRPGGVHTGEPYQGLGRYRADIGEISVMSTILLLTFYPWVFREIPLIATIIARVGLFNPAIAILETMVCLGLDRIAGKCHQPATVDKSYLPRLTLDNSLAHQEITSHRKAGEPLVCHAPPIPEVASLEMSLPTTFESIILSGCHMIFLTPEPIDILALYLTWLSLLLDPGCTRETSVQSAVEYYLLEVPMAMKQPGRCTL
ncbi:uncharacterized protein Z518_02715 [Rhinocladiella mackenziei CBS 650.93]|uniref:Rhinocladiella mackenziei CBS 650.93 unplaced genomic scaffold supercont1.2, whole genome shotgun sequence n=1 Tax=Rhinocladiella mackenziei CBS 650.93 TaxID=1442369 RepID=A0A0D2JFL7_9EURO|nr:uncharacterized protein Z518_02715 [Rhinocladiella mackenziei CBS 650.93]KIX08060.1 hypothetical protein Z518_02715 [Rhinocladiella mackenziei CBS 650.93]